MSFAYSDYLTPEFFSLSPHHALDTDYDLESASSEKVKEASTSLYRGFINPMPDVFGQLDLASLGSSPMVDLFGPGSYPAGPAACWPDTSAWSLGPGSGDPTSFVAQSSLRFEASCNVTPWTEQAIVQQALAAYPSTPVLTDSPGSSCDAFGSPGTPTCSNGLLYQTVEAPVFPPPTLSGTTWSSSDIAMYGAVLPLFQPSCSNPLGQTLPELDIDNLFPCLQRTSYDAPRGDVPSTISANGSPDLSGTNTQSSPPSSSIISVLSRTKKTKSKSSETPKHTKKTKSKSSNTSKRQVLPAPPRDSRSTGSACACATEGCHQTFGSTRELNRHQQKHNGAPVHDYFCANAECSGNMPKRPGDKHGYSRADSLLRHLNSPNVGDECVRACMAKGWRKGSRKSVRRLMVNPLEPSSYTHLIPRSCH